VILTSAQLDQLSTGFEQLLGQARESALAAGADTVDTRLLEGFAASATVDFAGAGSFDLIVMGTHGRKGIQHFLLGSVAERVVQTAPCAVLTVRAR
jgi:nucleotide-binding universal stress UspA family protein